MWENPWFPVRKIIYISGGFYTSMLVYRSGGYRRIIYIYILWHVENSPLIDDFPIETSISSGFPISPCLLRGYPSSPLSMTPAATGRWKASWSSVKIAATANRWSSAWWRGTLAFPPRPRVFKVMGEIMRQYLLVNEQQAVENGNMAHLVRWFTYENN